ncbi:MAG: ABC transporter permease [Chitinophagaceae bacterium]|nr:ABC transporter permease [Chitinophagaceae bacterium]
MLKNYFKIAWRNLWKSKTYSSINIIGLAVGMACMVLMVLFVKNELSYDTFHQKGPQLYRLTTTIPDKAGGKKTIGASGQVQGPAFKEAVPEILDYTRFWDVGGFNIIGEGKSLIQQGLFADSSFFRMFTFPLLHGDPETALADPFSIVITENTAIKYFGKTDVVGKILKVEEQGFRPLTITGVAKQPPANSSIRFDVVLTFRFLQSFFKDELWLNQYLTTFVLLHPLADPKKVEEKFAPVFRIKAGDQLTDPVKADGFSTRPSFGLQPIRDIHLNASTIENASGTFDGSSYSTLLFLSGIAVFILVMACINFVNFTIAHSQKRAKEIGIRKINGSRKRHIIGQFLVEAGLLCTGAFVLAIVLSNLLLPLFNALVGRQLELTFFREKETLAALVAILAISIIMAGLYPAFVLSRFNAAEVLYNKQKLLGRNWLGKSLVVFQFTLAIAFITATIIYYLQMDFILKKDLGYNASDVILVKLPPQRNPDQLVKLFRNELAAEPSVVMVGGGHSMPGEGSWGGGDPIPVNGKEIPSHKIRADEYYLPVLEIPLREGRNFSKDFGTDSMNSIIVNETFVRAAGLTNPIGTRVKLPGEWEGDLTTTIIGVAKDFHHNSLKDKISPMLLVMKHYETLMVKTKKGKSLAVLATLEKLYKKHIADSPFQFGFLADNIKNQYSGERYWQKVINYAAGVSIFICSLGLFGLSWLAAHRRTREIGIRKVLGATVTGIAGLLAKEFVKLVLIAFLVASPVCWLAMNKWIEHFAYRIDIRWWMFGLAGMIAVLIALITVSFQAIKAAVANPVKSLRTE